MPGSCSLVDLGSDPLYPVVAAQDRNRLGVTFTLTVLLPPVRQTYYIAHPYQVCESCCNARGVCRTCNCRTEYQCEQRVQWLYERIRGAEITLRLREGSRRWIEGRLALFHPGAIVHQPVHQGAFQIVESAKQSGAVARFVGRAQFFPPDPGMYDLTVVVQTDGVPGSPIGPRTLGSFTRAVGPGVNPFWTPDWRQPIYVLETSLVR